MIFLKVNILFTPFLPNHLKHASEFPLQLQPEKEKDRKTKKKNQQPTVSSTNWKRKGHAEKKRKKETPRNCLKS